MQRAIVAAVCFVGFLIVADQASAQSAQCQAAISAYNQRVASFNARCGGVSSGAQAAACNAERQQLAASRPNCQ